SICDTDVMLLSTNYVASFIARGLCKHKDELRPVVERMLHSQIEKVREIGGRIACVGRLYHPDLDHLFQAAMTGDPACRLGAVEVARENLTHPDCRFRVRLLSVHSST